MDQQKVKEQADGPEKQKGAKKTDRIEESRPRREKKMTDAGREYQSSVRAQSYKRLCKELNKLAAQILTEDGTEISSEADQEVLDRWMLCYQDFVQSERDLRDLLAPDERVQHEKNHCQQIEEWNGLLQLLQHHDPRGLLYRPKTVLPPRGGGHQMQTARQDGRDDDVRSTSSRRSTSSSVRAKLVEMRLQDERLRAEAEIKMAALQSKRQLDKMKQELE